ncbi:hypothetical protein IV38_GL000311 [Lactobacillus selangorensis]|uniref:DUF2929 family protein n=1 Tax=Lactobacillus selangorensis TaxID=81857 RepID=A0A0R2FLF6_9LACO|nr:DUF2929 family protein [Lactobacillus selangorensis]KRN29427.1 hypothetical protein IV38_GL000311 [Lactobacillus selangorensis]KRN34044.1 hypothetical protein IV40_GL000357 [Lactobacillus selangorensis]
MKYIAMIVWALILGLVAGFIGASLTQTAFSVPHTLITMGVFAILLGILPNLTAHYSTK